MDHIPERARPLRPKRIVHEDLRGGQIVSVSLPNLTIKLHLEHSLIGERTIAASLLPADVAAVVGNAVVVRVADPDYTITEVRSARFCDQPGPQTESVAAGIFSPGCVRYPKGEEYRP